MEGNPYIQLLSPSREGGGAPSQFYIEDSLLIPVTLESENNASTFLTIPDNANERVIDGGRIDLGTESIARHSLLRDFITGTSEQATSTNKQENFSSLISHVGEDNAESSLPENKRKRKVL